MKIVDQIRHRMAQPPAVVIKPQMARESKVCHAAQFAIVGHCFGKAHTDAGPD